MKMIESTDGRIDATSIVRLKQVEPTMQHPAMAQVEAYWEGLKSGRAMPFRSEVDPRGIDRALENAFILERIAPGIARFRLAGMHLNDLMGMEVRGMPMTSFFTPESRRNIGDALEHLFEAPAKVRIALSGEIGIGKPALGGELLLLPLKSDLGDCSRALGCLVSDGRIGRTPRRFEASRVDVVDIDARLFPQSDAERQSSEPRITPNTPVAGFAESEAEFKPNRPRPRGKPEGAGGSAERPYLRLIRGEKTDT